MKARSMLLTVCALIPANAFAPGEPRKCQSTKQRVSTRAKAQMEKWLADDAKRYTKALSELEEANLLELEDEHSKSNPTRGIRQPQSAISQPQRNQDFATASMEATSEGQDTNRAFTQRQNIVNPRKVTVQGGGALKTWSYYDSCIECVRIEMETDGRPLEGRVDLWQGPDNIPQKMNIYIEDGSLRPFKMAIRTPNYPNTVAIQNVAQLEFPFKASVSLHVDSPSVSAQDAEVIQGGSLRTFPFNATVEAVEIELSTDGRPLNARIELLQGPNNNKQVIEVYTENGVERPFHALVETPGSGSVVRVINTATLEFPLMASLAVHKTTSTEELNMEPVMTGGRSIGFQTSESLWMQSQ
uniref:Uncharacterized protein n=1 Tax=Entomoneis paludosa TaxID=265537 RepID=A0A6U3B3K4_9STRA|mmetsp:Transcript_27259/g.57096  ORF Transcript_27259/g.57096 Transcript_27259/m.57096 type:complete len:357 (+) Transcript_27259:233-1303(+)